MRGSDANAERATNARRMAEMHGDNGGENMVVGIDLELHYGQVVDLGTDVACGLDVKRLAVGKERT